MWVLKQELGSLRLPFSPTKPCTEGATLNRWCQTLPWQQVSLQTEQRQDRVRQRQAGCPAGMLPPTPYLHNQWRLQKEDIVSVEGFKSQQISVPQVQFLYLGDAKPNWTQSSIIPTGWQLFRFLLRTYTERWKRQGRTITHLTLRRWNFSPTRYKLTALNQIKCKPNSFCGTILQNIPWSLKRISFIVFLNIKFLPRIKAWKYEKTSSQTMQTSIFLAHMPPVVFYSPDLTVLYLMVAKLHTVQHFMG